MLVTLYSWLPPQTHKDSHPITDPKPPQFSSLACAVTGRLSTIHNDFDPQNASANTMNTEPWVTAEHVAKHLGVAKDTVYRWREKKALPAHRVGRLWKFQLSEIDEWVRAGGADETPEPGAPQK